MKQTFLTGAILASIATFAVGSSIAVSSLLSQYPALGGQAVRYGLGAAALALVVRARGLTLPRLDMHAILLLLLLATTGLVGFNLCLLAAVHYSDPSAIGAVIGCVPIFLALVGPLLQRHAPQISVVLGALIVSAGAVIAQGSGTTSPAGISFSLGALLCEVTFTLLAVPLLPRLGPLVLSLYVCIVASIMLAILSIAIDGVHAVPLLQIASCSPWPISRSW